LDIMYSSTAVGVIADYSARQGFLYHSA